MVCWGHDLLLNLRCHVYKTCVLGLRSSVLVETNELGVLSESSSGHVDAVLSDESLA